MRNLKNTYSHHAKVAHDSPLTATTWDPATDSLICALGPSKHNHSITLVRYRSSSPTAGPPENVLQNIASWDVPCPSPEVVCDKVVSLHYFADEATACLVLSGGDIIVVREDPNSGQDRVEIIGTVDAGISTARWSPDEELLALCSLSNNLLFMTRALEFVTETVMTAEDLNASKHVSVGWGKSETQFKGKRAKALRDPTMPEKTDQGLPSPLDQGQVTISWRGDGAYLAVSKLDSGRGRVIRIYSREGDLDGVGEPVDGLEGALSWRPAGNLIASVQRLEDRVDVVFFERNGLRHGQFNLRLDPDEMKSRASAISLQWNIDSSVLAVCFVDRVQLWTMGNYHYYLKHEIQVTATEPALVAGSTPWHPEKPLRIVLPSSDHALILDYAMMPAGGSVLPPHDLGALAVIDGQTLKLTPLRLANIPPPLAFKDIGVEANIVDAAFNQTGSQVAVLLNDGVKVYDWSFKFGSERTHALAHSLEVLQSSPESILRQICFLGSSRLCVLESTGSASVIHGYDLDPDGSSRSKYTLTIPGSATRIFARSDHKKVCFQTEARTVMEGEPIDGELNCRKITRMSALTPWLEVLLLNDEPMAFGLSPNGLLFANDRLLVNNCTSFLLAPAHLVFTTTQHLLKFVHVATRDDLEIPPDSPENDERCRSIERGARLVTLMPSSFSLTLQMPRGNLETIYPRALVLAGIRKSIAAKDYKTAFYACRNQRVDMNILHDHAPDQFISRVGLLVDQIKKVEHIDLLLSQLREEDVAKTMYKDTVAAKGATRDADAPQGPLGKAENISPNRDDTSKVNRICDAFLAILNTRVDTNLQNIITAHVCKVPPDLDAGLTRIGSLRHDDAELAEKAVEHICFLADVNKLYDSALGLYDLDLALLVAQQSQKDPREYLPYLQQLQELPQLRRQFAIDSSLGRYAKAVKHLHGLGAADELKAYVVKNEIYREALALYRYQEDGLYEIVKLYAEYLQSHSRFRQAGVAFEYVSKYRQAMEAYRAASCWQEALFCASQAGLPSGQIEHLATSLADAALESKHYHTAAAIYLDYKGDVENAARLLCKGYCFAEAMRLICLRGRQDLLEPVIDHGLVECLASSTELLADCKGQINAQVPRLRELRVKRDGDPLAYYDGATTEADVPDNVSLAETDASTSASLFTRYTGRTGSLNTETTRRTSKNRRREERKRARGKKGSVYEEGYLVNSIRRLIERVDSVREDVEKLIISCARRGMREQAIAIESAMMEVVGLCRACVDEVFAGTQPRPTANERWGGERLDGDDILPVEHAIKSSQSIAVPDIKAFERLALLGG